MAYNEFAYFYDEFNGEADYDALYSHIHSQLEAHGIRDGILADLGCGTGELTLMLTQAGYDMIGIDQSEEMLCVVRDKAEQLGLSGRLLLLRQGLLSPEEAAHHPDRHAITRAIGVEPEVQPDYTVIDLLRGDALLLCSDGLYNPLPPGELAGTLQEILQGGDIHTLIAKANAAGGPDNITAVLIHNR